MIYNITLGVIAYLLTGWLTLMMGFRFNVYSVYRAEAMLQKALFFFFWPIVWGVEAVDFVVNFVTESARYIGTNDK